MPPVVQPTSSIDPTLLNALSDAVNRVFDSALLSVAVTEPTARVDVSAIRDEMSQFVNACISQRTNVINKHMSPIMTLPQDIFTLILELGEFDTNDRVSIVHVCKDWAYFSSARKIAVTMPAPLDELTVNEINDIDFALDRLLGNPPIRRLAFDTQNFISRAEFGVLTRFLERHISHAQTLDCYITWQAPSGSSVSDLTRCLGMPTEVLTRLAIGVISPPRDHNNNISFPWFGHQAPHLTTVQFRRQAFFCPAFANVCTVIFHVAYTYMSEHSFVDRDVRVIFTQFPRLRKVVFRDGAVFVHSLFQAPASLERLEIFDALDTKFLDSVDLAAVPWVEVHFSPRSRPPRLTEDTRQALSAHPAVKLHVHFDSKNRVLLKLVDAGGRTRIYSDLDLKECLDLPLFSRVKSMAITGMDVMYPERNQHGSDSFREMADLEEVSFVIGNHPMVWIKVPCPRLAVFELVFRPHLSSIEPNVIPTDVTEFYERTIDADASGVLGRLHGLNMTPSGSAELLRYFSDIHIGSSLDPSVLPKCT